MQITTYKPWPPARSTSCNTQLDMDWFSWLSQSTLEPKLIHKYGLAFAQNQLQQDDLTYFNHEFLQSMGISVAKHRLEILKLVKKEQPARLNNMSKLILAINNTTIGIKNCIKKLVFHENFAVKAFSKQSPIQSQLRGALSRKYKSVKELRIEAPITPPILSKARTQAKSGPLESKSGDKPPLANRSLKLSGPLNSKEQQEMWVVAYRSPRFSKTPDGGMQQKFMVTHRSPQLPTYLNKRIPSPVRNSVYSNDVEGNGDLHSVWAGLFQDMKPT